LKNKEMKVIISGYGKMGHIVEKILNQQGIECVAASEDITAVDTEVAKQCVCIDFTTPDAFRANYPFLAKNFKAVVVGTTGWNDIKEQVIGEFEKNNTPMIYGSNFSIGVNIFFAITDYASKLMQKFGGYMPYINEKHHCHKLDAPSGTAKSLAAIVENNMGTKVDMSAVRCGEIPGIHTVGFEGLNDRITMTHEAFSREGFAAGAVEAAKIAENAQGVHEFKDLIFNGND
jgi:4-hydroxy-tetrahydrodipicolinate reductase